jgi:hypothetical protein
MPRPRLSTTLRRVVTQRARHRCEYCQSRSDYAAEPFDVEHIVPISRGGLPQADNLAYACSGCNGHKYNKISATDPLDGTEVALYHPRQQEWHDHFTWDVSYTLVVGLTATGRATVEALRLNRPGLVNLRRLLLLIGKQPPPTTT